MSVNTYGTATSGNPTNVYQVTAKLLKSADAVVTSDKVAHTEPVPANSGETVSFLRAVTPAPNVNETPEATNPTPRALTFEQVTKTAEEFAEAFAVSSRQAELGEVNVLMHSKDRLKDLLLRTREKNAWFEWRAANNVAYNSPAHTVRTSVNGPLTGGRLRVVDRLMEANRAIKFRDMTKGSLNQGTVPIEGGYLVLCHTDCKSDIRNLPGVVLAHQAGGMKDALPGYFATWENFHFIVNPEYEPFLAGGAAVGTTGMKSVGGVSVDVYTYLCIGFQALGKCNFKGLKTAGGFGAAEFNLLDKADKADITNARRYVSARWYDAPVILNQNWTFAVECGVTNNPA